MGDHINRMFFKKIFIFFLDCISFNTPQAIIFNILIIFLMLAIIPTNYLIYSPVKCIFKNVIFPIIFSESCPVAGLFANCECPACGLTRALSSLLHGDISSALNYNVLVIPLFLVMLFVLILNIIKLIKKS